VKEVGGVCLEKDCNLVRDCMYKLPIRLFQVLNSHSCRYW